MFSFDHYAANKASSETPKTTFLTRCASAGASKCEEKVKKGSWRVAGCCFLFLWQSRLETGHNVLTLSGCKFDSINSQFSKHLPCSSWLLFSSHCGENCGKIHIPNCVPWLKCSTFHRNIKSVKLPRQQKINGLIVYEAPVSVNASSRGHHWVPRWVLLSDALSLRDQAWFWVICCDLWQEDCVHLSALWSFLTPSSCG